ncbi:MAG: citryl-CoA lyase [Pseudorhodoplanes sp.]
MSDGNEQWPDQRRWVSAISRVEPDEILLRGYPHTSVIRNLSFAESFFLMVRGELPTPQQRRMLDALLCAVPDYGLFKPGTVAARIAISGNPSVSAGLAVALLSAGQHTLDPFDAGNFIYAIHAQYAESGKSMEDFAKEIVEEKRKKKERIPGFGHPIFEYVDPRAVALRDVAEKNDLLGDKLALYETIHRAFTRLPGRKTVPINDIGMSAALLAGMGFTPAEMTGVLLTSTIPGIVAHLSEELQQNVRIRVVDESLQRYSGKERRELPVRGDGR